MADEKENYPIIPEKNWWTLRKKFKQSLPSNVSTSYLSTLLGIGLPAAGNIIPTLRKIGLIDDEGAIKDRAKQWRDDAQYAKVCSDMRNDLYPQELRDLFPSPTDSEKDAIARWFANRVAVGEAASKMMASFYLLLSEANPSAEAEVKPKAEKPKEKPKVELKPKPKIEQEHVDTGTKDDTEKELSVPSININVEVHISSDADATQIDKIFESMAKHLNIRRKISNG